MLPWRRLRVAPRANLQPAESTVEHTGVRSPESGVRSPESGIRSSNGNVVSNRVRYDPAYRVLDYPGGDVPGDTGVCTDVVIRSLRKLGLDLQALIHKDMKESFAAYPPIWGLTAPDPNIDHRRVPNVETFLRRAGHAIPITENSGDYIPGDITSWRIAGKPHIGIVVNRSQTPGGRPMVVHNIGAGPELDDVLLS